MADAISITCPKCDTAMNVPSKLAGKKVRCKGCEAAVAVPAAEVRETFKLAEPAAPPRPAKAPKKKAVPPPAPAKKKPVEDDDDANPYGAIIEDQNIVRCAFCAKELDPPDARICQNCGYDMQERRRHESKNVYENSIGDYLAHHALTILAFVTIIGLIVADVIFFQNMSEWFEGSWMVKEEKDLISGKPTYWISPGLVLTWVTIMFLGLGWYAGRFIARKVQDFHPREKLTAE